MRSTCHCGHAARSRCAHNVGLVGTSPRAYTCHDEVTNLQRKQLTAKRSEACRRFQLVTSGACPSELASQHALGEAPARFVREQIQRTHQVGQFNHSSYVVTVDRIPVPHNLTVAKSRACGHRQPTTGVEGQKREKQARARGRTECTGWGQQQWPYLWHSSC